MMMASRYGSSGASTSSSSSSSPATTTSTISSSSSTTTSSSSFASALWMSDSDSSRSRTSNSSNSSTSRIDSDSESDRTFVSTSVEEEEEEEEENDDRRSHFVRTRNGLSKNSSSSNNNNSKKDSAASSIQSLSHQVVVAAAADSIHSNSSSNSNNDSEPKLNAMLWTDPTEEKDDSLLACTPKEGRSLLNLPPELCILVLSYSTLPETRLMMQVHSQFRNLLHSAIRRCRCRCRPDTKTNHPDEDDDPLDDDNTHNHSVDYDAVKHGHGHHDAPIAEWTVWNEHVHRLWPPLLTVRPDDHNHHSKTSSSHQPVMQFTHSASQLLAIAQPVPSVMMMGVVEHHQNDRAATTTTTTTAPSSSSSNPSLSQTALPRRRRPLMMVHSLPRNQIEEEEEEENDNRNTNHRPPRNTSRTDDSGDEYYYYYYQYTGPVGQGDRCIRAKVPLPHVTWTLSKKRKGVDHPSWQDPDDDDNDEEHGDGAWNSLRGHWHHHHSHHHQSLFQRFWLRSCTQALAAALSTPPLTWRPFCTPLRHKDGRIVLAPRVVSYFEVSIRAPPPDDETDDDYYHNYSYSRMRTARASSSSSSSSTTTTTTTTTTADCIAVGICTRLFRWKARMPGWDNHSIGYHSDDGGLFFGSGSMQRRYGPQFGPGDTIGCALDHVRRVVFFTRNGRSLGPAVQLAQPVAPSSRPTDRSAPAPSVVPPEWYPVVGLDSNALVHCNFIGPFVFDLDQYERERYGVMMEQAMTVPPPVMQA